MSKYLDLIFDGRIKEYGAYQIRKNYSRNLMVSTLLVCFTISLLFVIPQVMSSKEVSRSDIQVSMTELYLSPPPVKEVEKIETQKKEVEQKSKSASNIRFTDIEVVDDLVVDDLKPQEEIVDQKLGLENSNDSLSIIEPGVETIVEDKEDVIFSFASEMPKYRGDLYSDLSKLIVYPELEKESGIECLIYLNVVVNKDGNISDVTLLRGCSLSSRFGEVAIRAVKKLSSFEPAKMNGRPVSIKITIPVKFSLR